MVGAATAMMVVVVVRRGWMILYPMVSPLAIVPPLPLFGKARAKVMAPVVKW